MNVILFAVPALLAAALSYCLVPPVRILAFRVGAIDLPGPRKIHSAPMARLGGLAVVVAAFLVFGGLAYLAPRHSHQLAPDLLAGIAGGLIPIFLVSFIDDIRSVRALKKLFCHFCGAAVVVALGNRFPDTITAFGSEVHLGWVAIPLSLVWIACVTNAFNIIDGLDGLSAGLALISALSLAAVSLVTGQIAIAAASLILAGALIGFLPYNIYPARIFLGDTGATAIGFVLACLTLRGSSITSAGLAVALPLLIVGVPLADTVVSVARRVVARLEGNTGGVFDADRRHIHHRLLALGLTQWRASLTLYTAGAVFASTALLSLFIEQKKAALLLMGILVAAFIGIYKLGYDELAVWRRESILRIYDAPVLRVGLFIAFIDIALVIAALYASMILKYDDWNLSDQRLITTQLLALLPALTIAVFATMHVYRASWRSANVQDILALGAATLTSGFTGYILSVILLDSTVTPTFFVLYTMCLFLLVATCRLSYRVLCHWNRRGNQRGEPILIYGAGEGGALALREIQTNFDVAMVPVGFIDDDPTKSGRWVNGYPVLGSVAVLENVVNTRGIRGVVVASEKIPIAKLNHARSLCNDSGLWFRRFRVSFQDEFVEMPVVRGGGIPGTSSVQPAARAQS
jgi:UDP-GlcNAc:undecaprenyl-phosphate/decaprenyl-phosphate GlcNAc-1-phosphate transferase